MKEETKLQKAFEEVTEAIIKINELEEGTSIEMEFLHGETFTVIAFLVNKEPRIGNIMPLFRFKRTKSPNKH